MLVGHNDIGYEPDVPPVEVNDFLLARQILSNAVVQWFTPEVDGEELTQYDVLAFAHHVRNLRQPGKVVFRGHAFWVH